MARGRKGAERKSGTPRLFEAGEMQLRPTGRSRFRSLARRPALPESDRQRRKDEDFRTIERLRDQGAVLCRRFRLRYKSIDPERDGVVEHYGVCYEDGVILIRLRHARTGLLLKESSLVDTLCHELAHLRHLDHSARFRKLYWRILDAAREIGYYRPGPATGEGPRQLDLFDPGACGVVSANSREES